MRLSGVYPGDLVLVEDTAGRTSLALVERVGARCLDVTPFDGRAPQEVSARRVVDHWRHRGELAARSPAIRGVLGRSRARHGAAAGMDQLRKGAGLPPIPDEAAWA